QGPHRALGGVVGDVDAALSGDPGNRRNVDDRAAADLLHLGDRELHAEEGAGRIDRHDLVPGGAVEQVFLTAAADAGVVDQDVELAVGREGGVDRRPP